MTWSVLIALGLALEVEEHAVAERRDAPTARTSSTLAAKRPSKSARILAASRTACAPRGELP